MGFAYGSRIGVGAEPSQGSVQLGSRFYESSLARAQP